MQERIIKCIREELEVSETDISDKELLARTKGSFMYARISLSLSVKDLINSIIK